MFGTPKRELRSQLSKYDRTEKNFPCQNMDGFRFSRMRMSLAPGRISTISNTCYHFRSSNRSSFNLFLHLCSVFSIRVVMLFLRLDFTLYSTKYG